VNSPVFFENAGDERGTPQAFFDELNREFHFDLDAAADETNHKCEMYFGKGGVAYDALEEDWGGLNVFLNPPYSIAGAFVEKARQEADKGATVVLLLPVRSDNRWWHKHIWDVKANRPVWTTRSGDDAELVPSDGNWRPGVRFRFIPGRLNFELKVPEKLRTWIKSESVAFGADNPKDADLTAWFKSMSAVTGLPKMAIERILLDYPDEDLMESAPFPSCIVIFTKAT